MPQTDDGAIFFDGTSGTGRYADWSVNTGGGCNLEIGQGNDATGIDLTWAELAQLTTAFQATLRAHGF
jgi:hypothetical protein